MSIFGNDEKCLDEIIERNWPSDILIKTLNFYSNLTGASLVEIKLSKDEYKKLMDQLRSKWAGGIYSSHGFTKVTEE